MKKILSLLIAAVMVLAFASCGNTGNTDDTTAATETTAAPEETTAAPTGDDIVKVMTHAEYIAAAMDAKVTVETYVQAHQSWWNDKVTVYCQSPDGAYFLYELACSEADAAKLVPGTKIRVSGTKGAWSGEVEIMNGTFEFVEGGDKFVADAFDATELLGKDELLNHQNEFAIFKGLTVEKVEYKNGQPGDDIYVTFKKGDASYNFCVEYYLTNDKTDVYKAVGELKAGDVVDVEGFIYWYEGVNTHITSITAAK